MHCPKVLHCLLHDGDVSYSEFWVLVSFKTLEELLHLCFASLMEASGIPLWYVHAMCIVILNWNSAAYYLLYVCLWLITWKKDCFVHCPCSMVSKLAKLFRSTCLYTSNEAKEFVKVSFVASSSLNWIAWGQAIAKLGGVDTSQTYLLFQTLLLLFWLHSCIIWTKLTRTNAVFSRATSAVFFCAGFWIFRYVGKIPKNYIKNQHSRSFREAKGGPQGSQQGAWRGLAPSRATCPPGWVPHPLVP